MILAGMPPPAPCRPQSPAVEYLPDPTTAPFGGALRCSRHAAEPGRLMPRKRYLMNAGRTTKQGQQINQGKDSPEYQAIVSTIIMNPDDMKEEGIPSGSNVLVRSDTGEATFLCKEGKV